MGAALLDALWVTVIWNLLKAYEVMDESPHVSRINIEIALDAPLDDMDQALEMENQAVRRSIDYCRKQLNIG